MMPFTKTRKPGGRAVCLGGSRVLLGHVETEVCCNHSGGALNVHLEFSARTGETCIYIYLPQEMACGNLSSLTMD